MVHRRIAIQATIISIADTLYSKPASGQNRSKSAFLPLPTDLLAASRAAQLSGQPLVVMVSLPGCPWCELLRRNYLNPMRAEGLPAFEFMVNDRSQSLRDFQGNSTSPQTLARQWKVSLTPTVLFFNAQGQEIALRIEGVASADFIGAVIDERLASASESIKAAR